MIVMIQQGPDAGQQVRLERGLLTIGRGGDCDLVLNEPQASRHHAELRRYGDQWLVVDVGSTNGTFLGGARLRPDEARPLSPGEQVTIGSTRFALQSEPQDAADAQLLDEWLGPEAAPAAPLSPAWTVGAWLGRVVVVVGSVLLIAGALQDWVQVQVDAPLVGRVVDRTFSGMDSGQSWLFFGVAGLALVLMLFDLVAERWGLAAGLGQALAGALAAAAVALDAYRYYQVGTEQFLGVSLLDIFAEYAREFINIDILSGVYLVGAGLACLILGGLIRLVVAGLAPTEI